METVIEENKTALSDWYVLQTRSGKEEYIQALIRKIMDSEVEMLSFSRELIHSKKGRCIKRKNPLFPGYIFVHKQINEVVAGLRRLSVDEFYYPVSFNGRPGRVCEDEMKLLLKNTDDKGTFRISRGWKEGEKIVISDGPLKAMKGKIIFINEKKSRAKIELSVFKRKMGVSLGLELLEKSEY